MNKQEIKQELKSEYGNFICVNEVASFLRIDRGTARSVLYGLPHITFGNKKMYSADDVAGRLMERMET